MSVFIIDQIQLCHLDKSFYHKIEKPRKREDLVAEVSIDLIKAEKVVVVRFFSPGDHRISHIAVRKEALSDFLRNSFKYIKFFGEVPVKQRSALLELRTSEDLVQKLNCLKVVTRGFGHEVVMWVARSVFVLRHGHIQSSQSSSHGSEIIQLRIDCPLHTKTICTHREALGFLVAIISKFFRNPHLTNCRIRRSDRHYPRYQCLVVGNEASDGLLSPANQSGRNQSHECGQNSGDDQRIFCVASHPENLPRIIATKRFAHSSPFRNQRVGLAQVVGDAL